MRTGVAIQTSNYNWGNVLPFCGINEDNIYTFWDGGDIRRGGLPVPGASGATDRLDSFLVNDSP